MTGKNFPIIMPPSNIAQPGVGIAVPPFGGLGPGTIDGVSPAAVYSLTPSTRLIIQYLPTLVEAQAGSVLPAGPCIIGLPSMFNYMYPWALPVSTFIVNGNKNTPLIFPRAIVSRFQITRPGGLVAPPYVQAMNSPGIIADANGKGINLFLYNADAGASPDFYPILQCFPVTRINSYEIDETTGVVGGPLTVTPIGCYDVFIDPTCFIGGDILSISLHVIPPYTSYVSGILGYTYMPPFADAGILTSGPTEIGDNSGSVNKIAGCTSIFTRFLHNQIDQINAVIAAGVIGKFRHVFIVDNGKCPAGIDENGNQITISDYPNWDGVLSQLNQSWMNVVSADFSDPTQAESIVAAQIADFFA